MLFAKPAKGSYAFINADPKAYNDYACNYAKCKRIGIRSVYAWATGAGVVDVVKEVGVGTLRTWGRRKFGTVVIGGLTYLCSPLAVFVTNSSKIINTSKKIHSGIAYVIECADDLGGLAYLPLDLVLFGQPIPMGEPGRFNFYKNFTDFLD